SPLWLTTPDETILYATSHRTIRLSVPISDGRRFPIEQGENDAPADAFQAKLGGTATRAAAAALSA
uniref:hypothetical protein n=1 Tax=Caballeronia arationis TaxID=1777142 RepID=UPI001F249B33